MNICQPLSPVCWRMWLTRCSFLVNDLEQKPHRCGDSPVCWRTWFRRCSFRVNVFEQKSQRCGVSPVCHIMWFVKCSFLVNDLPAYSSDKQKEIEKRRISLDCNANNTRVYKSCIVERVWDDSKTWDSQFVTSMSFYKDTNIIIICIQVLTCLILICT